MGVLIFWNGCAIISTCNPINSRIFFPLQWLSHFYEVGLNHQKLMNFLWNQTHTKTLKQNWNIVHREVSVDNFPALFILSSKCDSIILRFVKSWLFSLKNRIFLQNHLLSYQISWWLLFSRELRTVKFIRVFKFVIIAG